MMLKRKGVYSISSSMTSQDLCPLSQPVLPIFFTGRKGMALLRIISSASWNVS